MIQELNEELDYELTVMEIITNSGQCKSLSFMALQQAKQGNFDEANRLIEEANIAERKAHEVQTAIINYDAGEGKLPVYLVMVHAQDHLMTSKLAKELIIEMIDLLRKMK